MCFLNSTSSNMIKTCTLTLAVPAIRTTSHKLRQQSVHPHIGTAAR